MSLGFDDPRGVAFCAHGPVPEGHLKIAQRFSVGFNGKTELVPKGRLKVLTLFSRPFGTHTSTPVEPNAEARSVGRARVIHLAKPGSPRSVSERRSATGTP